MFYFIYSISQKWLENNITKVLYSLMKKINIHTFNLQFEKITFSKQNIEGYDFLIAHNIARSKWKSNILKKKADLKK